MKLKYGLFIALALIMLSILKPVLYKPFVYEASNIHITVIYDNQTVDLELLPYSKLSVIKEHITLHDDIDVSKLNFNQVLKDGDVITLPLVSEIQCVSINTGTQEELMTLSGVGPAIAQRIIDHRNEYGTFQSLEAIMDVKGIKERLFERMAAMICL